MTECSHSVFLRVHLLFSSSSSSPLSPPATCFLLLRLLNLTLQSVCARSWPTDGRTKERSERKKKEEEETNRIRKEECGLKRAGKKKRRRRESSSSSSLYVEGSSSFLSLLPTFRLSLSLLLLLLLVSGVLLCTRLLTPQGDFKRISLGEGGSDTERTPPGTHWPGVVAARPPNRVLRSLNTSLSLFFSRFFCAVNQTTNKLSSRGGS